MYISVSIKSITQKSKSIKTKTFLSTLNIYKIYTHKTKNDKHHTVLRYVYIYDILK